MISSLLTSLLRGQALSMNVSKLMVRIAGTASSNYTYIQVNAIGRGLDKKQMRVRVQEN